MWRWALVLLVLARSAPAAEPPHLALVVSNSAYQNLPPLPACQASGAIVAASLTRAGWAVTQLRDPSNGQLGAGLAQFADRVAKAPGAAALVYTCGYAAPFETRLFLLPTSARLVRDTDALTEGIVLAALTGVVSRADVAAGLVVADLIALPGQKPVPAEGAVRRNPGPRTGLVVLSSPAGGPDGPTPTASRLATALAEPNLSVGVAQSLVMGDGAPVRGALGYVEPPAQEAWLAGGPPPAPPPPAPPPQIVAQPAPAAPPPEPPPPPAPEAPATPPPPASPTPSAEPAPSAEPPPSNAPATIGDLDRRRVQLALQHLGYYAGKVDGTFGPESLAAIRRYQHELGAEMTGRLTEAQVARLLATP